MKNILYKLIIAGALLVSIFACSESFLEVDQRGLTPQEDFYKTDDDALLAIVAAYDMLQTMYAEDWNSMWFLKTCPGGELSQPDDDQPQYYRLTQFQYSASNSTIAKVYRDLYFGIFRANIIIQKIAADSDAKKQVIAEAKFLRGFFYFELVTLFGEVPLVLEVLPTGEYDVPKETIPNLWAQIEKDLTEAAAGLPVKSALDYAFRASKGTAQAYLGKALLYQEKFPQAVTEFDKVITSGEYDTISDFSQVLRVATEFGDESIFEVSFSTSEGHDWSTFPWGQGRAQENNIHWQLAGPRGDGYFDPGDSLEFRAGWGHAYPTSNIYAAFEAEDTLRRRASIMSESELIAYGGSMRNESGEMHTPNQGYIRLKYGTWNDETDAVSAGVIAELNYGTNVRLMRYADLLLLAAEANHKAGDDGTALELLNIVRHRAKVSERNSSGTALMDDIIYERTVELAFEGHRFADLVRWDLADDSLAANGYMDKHRYLPLPQDELDVSPSLEQNNEW